MTRSKDSHEHAGAALMRDAVGAARHQNEGDDVERAEARPTATAWQ